MFLILTVLLGDLLLDDALFLYACNGYWTYGKLKSNLFGRKRVKELEEYKQKMFWKCARIFLQYLFCTKKSILFLFDQFILYQISSTL